MKDGLLKCSRHCMDENIECENKECRLWIDYKKDSNCTLVAVKKQKTMTLREVADRLGVSFVRVKQIQDVAHKKMLKKLSNLK